MLLDNVVGARPPVGAHLLGCLAKPLPYPNNATNFRHHHRYHYYRRQSCQQDGDTGAGEGGRRAWQDNQ
eukprot:5669245-Pyramimonas_sp.AAC.2